MIDREVFIKETYEHLVSMPNQVFSIFIEYFGEDNVDLQGIPTIEEITDKFLSDSAIKELESITSDISKALEEKIITEFFKNIDILIRFGEVKVTNEYNKSVFIQGLWVKVPITTKGTCKGTTFFMNRSEYDVAHLQSDYMHSHISSIPTNNFSKFQSPCLGSGPIGNTLNSLYINFDEDTWSLFCFELDKYVRVESISGHPFKHLESIGKSNLQFSHLSLFSKNINFFYSSGSFSRLLKEFIAYYLTNNNLKFNFCDGAYSIGMSDIDYIVDISNKFIEWFNDKYNKKEVIVRLGDLLRYNMLIKGIISDGKIYDKLDYTNPSRYLEYEGEKVCTFKGESITLKIRGIKSDVVDNTVILFHPIVVSNILTEILKFINFNYGKTS